MFTDIGGNEGSHQPQLLHEGSFMKVQDSGLDLQDESHSSRRIRSPKPGHAFEVP